LPVIRHNDSGWHFWRGVLFDHEMIDLINRILAKQK